MPKTNAPARKKIIEAFRGLLRRKSYMDITVTDIINEAGVSRSTYYRNFYKRDEIVDAYCEQLRDEIHIHHEKAYKGNISNADMSEKLSFAFSFYRERRDDIMLLYRNGFGSQLLSVMNKYSEEIFGDMPYSSVEKYKVYFISGAMYNILIKWLETGAAEDPDELANTLEQYFYNGISYTRADTQ
jgi:AcrR family transcriptional regulator